MASRNARQMNYSSRYVSGNLAYDYDYLERERRRQEERERREYLERRQRESAPRPAPRKRALPRVREAQPVPLLAMLGFTVLGVMVVSLLMSYAQLNAVSTEIVSIQKEISAVEEEHVRLVTRYEQTFDMEAIKAAAAAAGMAKPSASQIYYVDLSEPDNVVIYESESESVLGRLATSMERNFSAFVEYFR